MEHTINRLRFARSRPVGSRPSAAGRRCRQQRIGIFCCSRPRACCRVRDLLPTGLLRAIAKPVYVCGSRPLFQEPERQRRPLQVPQPSSVRARCSAHAPLVRDLASHDQRLGDALPFVAERDALDRVHRAGSVVAGADEDCIRQRFDFAFDGIERPVHEVLHGARHVAEVLWRADQQAVRPQQIVNAGLSAGNARTSISSPACETPSCTAAPSDAYARRRVRRR